MVLTLGIILVVAAIALAGVAMMIPRSPTVPLDRRRPFRTEADSQLTRFAGSAVQGIERFLAKRTFRYFNRETLENAGLRLSQADFLLLVIIGAFQFSGWVAAAAMVVVIISAVYMLWMFQRVFFTVPSDWMRRWWPSLKDMSRGEWASLAPLIVLVVALGVYPGPVLEMISAPVERIVNAVNGAGLTGFGPLW